MLPRQVASKLEVVLAHSIGQWTNHTWQLTAFRQRVEMGKVQGQVAKEEAQAEIVMQLPKLLKVLLRDFKLLGSQPKQKKAT